MSLPLKKRLKGRRAVVIGSGPGGLAAAMALAIRGAKVVVLERGPVISPSMVPKEFDGYRFEPWPPMVPYPHLLAELFAGAGLRLTDFLTLERFSPVCTFHLGKDKEPFNVYTDRDQTLDEVARRFPDDVHGFQSLLRTAEKHAKAFDHVRRRFPLEARRAYLKPEVLKIANPTLPHQMVASAVLRKIADPDLQRVLLSLRTLNGQSMYRHGASSLRVLADLIHEGGWYVEGGMMALRNAMLRVCQLLKIKFVRDATVERVELQANRVRKIHGHGFSPIAATIIISNVGLLSTVRDLLPPSEESEKLLRQTKAGRRRAATAMIYRLGCGSLPFETAPLGILPSVMPKEESRFLDEWRIPSNHPTIAYSDHSCLDNDHAPEGKRAITLRLEMPPATHRFNWNDDSLRRYEEKIQESLAHHGMDVMLEEAIVREEVTPTEAENLPSFEWGSGMAQTATGLLDLQSQTPNRFPGVAGLYMAGGSVYPGAGFDNTILGGMMAAVLAAEDA